jgi:copper resistance protein B
VNAAQAGQRREVAAKDNRIARIAPVVLLVAAGWLVPPARAQDQPATDPQAEHPMMPAPATPSATSDAGMDMGSMQGGSAPPDARDPHAYSDGYDFGPYPLHMADTHSLASLLVDRLEAVRGDDGSSAAYDLQAWYGRTYDRAVLKAEGDVDGGEIEDARSELLWGHAVAAYWDTQLGLRHDSGVGPNRDWLAFGVQGLAPYWFEVELTGYLGEGGRTALRFETEYELLFTQRLILQPRLEANAYGRDDAARGLGSGLAWLTAGLRLRYEIRREFAPYVGIEWGRRVGETGDLARAAGEDASETAFVAGLRFWF